MPLASLSSSGPAFSDTLPASSLASPEFQIGQVTAAPEPLPPSNFATSISLTQPQGTSVPHLRTTLDDGIFDTPWAQTSTDVAVEIEQLDESTMSVPDIAALSIDSSCDIDHPE
jgi:hypothetical protein